MDGRRSWLALARTPGLHAGLLPPLLDRFGSAEQIAGRSRTELAAAGVGGRALDWLARPDPRLLDRDEHWLSLAGNHLATWGAPEYPVLLSRIPDPPVALYVRGTVDCLGLPQVAVVGSRNPTPPGAETAFEFAAALARAGITVTSGLAIGIDAASHRGALAAGGWTVAVCGTGLDDIYPASHASLAGEIAARGALVSEFPCGTPPARHNFPRRNRIISGLALGTLVVEAAPESGSLITARLAADHGREVFAVPGSLRNPLARGCHQLLKDGATLVESVADIVAELAQRLPEADTAPSRHRRHEDADSIRVSAARLDKDREILLDALGFEPAGVDQLVRRTGFGVGEVASMLLLLEMEGHVETFPGGLYVRAHPEGTK